jgi:hypothetical protein
VGGQVSGQVSGQRHRRLVAKCAGRGRCHRGYGLSRSGKDSAPSSCDTSPCPPSRHDQNPLPRRSPSEYATLPRPWLPWWSQQHPTGRLGHLWAPKLDGPRTTAACWPMSTRRRAITLLPCLSGWRNSLSAAQPTDRN